MPSHAYWQHLHDAAQGSIASTVPSSVASGPSGVAGAGGAASGSRCRNHTQRTHNPLLANYNPQHPPPAVRQGLNIDNKTAAHAEHARGRREQSDCRRPTTPSLMTNGRTPQELAHRSLFASALASAHLHVHGVMGAPSHHNKTTKKCVKTTVEGVGLAWVRRDAGGMR